VKQVKVLFLHGWHSVPGGVKPTYFIQHGHEVINPALSDDDFDAALTLAQEEFDKHRPDVIVASSRGGAIAMALKTDRVPLVLLCPAWKRWGSVHVVPANTTILHSRNDEVIPFADSEQLATASGLPRTALIETGHDHRLADPDSLRAMLNACLRAAKSCV
jgi:alpha/beta superfamily hydrolase